MIVAFTVNNRPDYLRQTLESWGRVRGIGEALLLFRCEPGCPEAVQVCTDFLVSSGIGGVVTVNEARFGVLGNPWVALESAFGEPLGEDFVILAEEDMVVSPVVSEYFAWCQRYRDDPTVLGVTTYQHHEQPGGLAGAGLADWSRDDQWHFWIWGTWRDRWENLLRDSWDMTYEENGGGPGQRGWDWKLRNTLVVGKGMKMIAPSLCRSQHIGRDGGTHCTPAQFESLLSGCYAGDDVPPQDYRDPALYECECCERRNVPRKLKGIGYVCDDCFDSYVWTGYEKGDAPLEHGAGRTCPFKNVAAQPGQGAAFGHSSSA